MLSNLEEIKKHMKTSLSSKIKKMSEIVEMKEKKEITFSDLNTKEDFFSCGEQEFIKDFLVLKHYLIVHLTSFNKDYFKFYNFRTKKFHNLQFEEFMY